MLAQINSVRGAFSLLALALVLTGCTPAGPRALLKGKKDLDRGDVAGAVLQLQRATSLLATNASAWNYYGVALQRDGQPDEAATAYANAIRLDRDLLEARFNLGCLHLEQNRADLAKAEFTTYTLRRPNDPTGWLKLGFAQLKAGETLPAERSFSSVLALKTDEAEAYNALGLASVQLGKPRDAAAFFAAAWQAGTNFAPALLNLATVNREHLHDNRAALANYQAYLALSPRPANYHEVKSLVDNLTQSDVVSPVMAPAVVSKPAVPPAEPKPKPEAPVPAHPLPAPHPEPEETHVSHPPPRPATEIVHPPAPVPEPVVVRQNEHSRAGEPAPATIAPQVVQVPPAPVFMVAPRTNVPGHPASQPTGPAAAQPASHPPVVTPRPAITNGVVAAKSLEAPLPAPNDHPAAAKSEGEEKPLTDKPAPALNFPRYAYTSPVKPAAGDRPAAGAAFAKAQLAEQDQNWAQAEQWYQTAAEADPAWFEAQYNTGVMAHRLRVFPVALFHYELALALQPDSVNARYNFALALKAAGYPVDAATELKRILASNPDEARAHLTLGNLCAQSLQDVPEARIHYLRVLELQPKNPQVADIRFWLSAHAKPAQ